MCNMAFKTKDPNLRHRGQKLIADCLGWTEKKERPLGGGFQINFFPAAPADLQVDQENPKKIEAEKPISLLK